MVSLCLTLQQLSLHASVDVMKYLMRMILMLRLRLHKLTYVAVRTAENGKDALAKLREKDSQIDLVLSDVYMPGRSCIRKPNFECQETIRAARGNLCTREALLFESHKEFE
jgi:CheY-like chemotaxis protein